MTLVFTGDELANGSDDRSWLCATAGDFCLVAAAEGELANGSVTLDARFGAAGREFNAAVEGFGGFVWIASMELVNSIGSSITLKPACVAVGFLRGGKVLVSWLSRLPWLGRVSWRGSTGNVR